MSQTERDSNGRFTTGNRGDQDDHRGQLKNHTSRRYSRCVSVEDWKSVGHRALQEAINGCHKFRQFLASYLIGQPRKTIELIGHEAADQAVEEYAVELLSHEECKTIDQAFALFERAEQEAREKLNRVQ